MPTATRLVDERATPALGIRPSACKANRPVSGWGQGRQPPEAVARSASLEASRSQGYFKIQLLASSRGALARTSDAQLRIWESLDSVFDAFASPRNDGGAPPSTLPP